MSIIFTRLLYAKDEVVASLNTSLLRKDNIEEPMFWMNELFESGFYEECFDVLWKTYYDFYAILHPCIDLYIQNKFIAWHRTRDKNTCPKGSIQPILDVVQKFYESQVSMHVFLLYRYSIYMETNATIMLYRKRGDLTKPRIIAQWIDDFAPEYHQLLLSIQKKNWDNIIHYIFDFVNEKNVVELFDTLRRFFQKAQERQVECEMGKHTRRSHHFLESWCDGAPDDLVKYPYQNWIQIILAYVIDKLVDVNVPINNDADMVDTKPRLDKSILDTYQSTRNYSIDWNMIGCFLLMRFQNETFDIVSVYRDDWLRNTIFTPFWRERIEGHNGRIEYDGAKVNFASEDDMENFYTDCYFNQLYGCNLEPDEQKLEEQEKSTHEIPKINVRDFCAHMGRILTYNHVQSDTNLIEMLLYVIENMPVFIEV